MPPSTLPLLSKSRFTAGLQCHLRLYRQCYERDLASPPDRVQQALFAAGTRVAVIARELRPGGVLVDEPAFDHDQAVARTRELLTKADTPAIYEAAFTEDDVRIRVDILARGAGESWDLIEVKSSTSQKDEHIPDIAVQLVTLQRAGVAVDRAAVAHVNRDYVYAGGFYRADELFTVADVTDEARDYAKRVPEQLAAMRAALSGDAAPEIDVGRHCTTPYACEFIAYCRRNEPEWSIDELPRLSGDRALALRTSGIRSILDIPASEQLTPTQETVRQAVTTGEPQIGPNLQSALDGIMAPAHFIDFETMNPALPVYAGTRPYEVLPFQWSDHVLSAGGSLTHEEFLAKGDEDPRREFAETLITQLAGAVTIVVYSSFEQTRLRQLADAMPDLRPALEAILSMSWVDLLQVVRSHYYHPDFHGSFSIKSVLPALVPEFGYGDLEIQGGDVASIAYLTLINKVSAETRESLRADLLAYCGRDTEAMVQIVEMLRTPPSRFPSQKGRAAVAKFEMQVLSVEGYQFERKWDFRGDLEELLDTMDRASTEIDASLARPNRDEESIPARLPGTLQAILFTDLESSTELTLRLGDEAAQEVVRSHNTTVRAALEEHGGHEVKHTGDGIMASFPSAVAAVRAALAIQRDFAGRSVRVRIGINAGEPIDEDADLFGTVVIMASRICGRAEPGQVLVSRVVADLCAGKMFQFTSVGDTILKGFSEPAALYEVSVS